MQACVDVAFPYAHLREAFGKKIGEHQVSLTMILFLLLYPVLLLQLCLIFHVLVLELYVTPFAPSLCLHASLMKKTACLAAFILSV